MSGQPTALGTLAATVFDYVIVGGGSAGCVMANRLSSVPENRVLLIEAGIDTPPGEVPPTILSSYPMPLFEGDRYTWPGLKVSAHATRLPMRYEQGRVLGGGSAINVQAANRGLPRDYDAWHEAGATGWSWEDVLPYFRRLERDQDFAGPLHGTAGPVPIRRIPQDEWNGFSNAVAGALASAGFPRIDDQNAEFGDGYFAPAISNTDDRRVSTASAYLDVETRQRPNLVLLTEHQVERIVFSNQRAAAVVLASAQGRFQVRCKRLVLTAGALQTPALLMRSGVGPGELLHTLGSSVVAHLPGVGRNLQDHPCLTLGHYLPRSLRAPPPPRRASLLALRFSSGAEGGVPSDMYVATSGRAAWHAVGAQMGLYYLWCNKPLSRGQLTIASLDAAAPPVVQLNLLSHPFDAARLAKGVRLLAEISQQPALGRSTGRLMPVSLSERAKSLSRLTRLNAVLAAAAAGVLDLAGPARVALLRRFVSDAPSLSHLLEDDGAMGVYLQQHVFGVWHASGTCRMGATHAIDTVVDPRGKLLGLENVWIADASVMPSLPSANTNIPTVMLAEKISDGLLAS